MRAEAVRYLYSSWGKRNLFGESMLSIEYQTEPFGSQAQFLSDLSQSLVISWSSFFPQSLSLKIDEDNGSLTGAFSETAELFERPNSDGVLRFTN